MNDPLGLFGDEMNTDPLGLFGEEDEKKKASWGTAIKQKFAEAANLADAAISLPAGALANYTGFQEQGDEVFRKMEERAKKNLAWANPEGAELSTAQQIGGTIATFPAQVLGMMGTPAEKGMDLIRRGEPLDHAILATQLEAAVNTAGVAPMMGVNSLVGRAALGGGTNMAFGAGSDAATQLLATQEETKQAYDPYDMERRLVEGVAGAALHGALGERGGSTDTPLARLRAEQILSKPETAPEAVPTAAGEQLRLFDQFEERSPVSPYQTEMASDMWRVDENGIPIRADLSMEVQNLQNPLQRNLWGDELVANFPKDPNKPLTMGTGDIVGTERFSDPTSFRNDPENQRPLTEAIDNMPAGVRNRTPDGRLAPGTTRQSALDLLRRELPADHQLQTAVQDADMVQWLRENEVKAKLPLGSKARKNALARTGRAKRQGGGVTTDIFGRTPELSTKLQDLLKTVPYRFQAMEQLPNKDIITGEQIKQVINREGVSAAEKAVIVEAWEASRTSEEGVVLSGKAKSTEFVKALEAVIVDLKLSAEKSTEYADFGLSRIGRFVEEIRENIPRDEWTDEHLRDYHDYGIFPSREIMDPEGLLNPETTLWNSQNELSRGVQNHFDNDNTVGHTRSFTEEGIRHVVEIQSDLLQKYSEPKSPSKPGGKLATMSQDQLIEAIQEATKLGRAAFEAWDNLPHDVALRNAQRDVITRYERIAEAATRELEYRQQAANVPSINKLQKNWHVRLIREELARAARNNEPEVRFASADTMAKVEGWPDESGRWRTEYEEIMRQVKAIDNMLSQESINNRLGFKESLEHDRAWYLTEAEKLLDKLVEYEKTGRRFEPRLQGIYDRYQKDVTKYLTSIGGKPMTDSKGNTWISVPVEKHRQRPIMFGQRGGLLIDWKDANRIDNSFTRSSDNSFIPENPDVAKMLEKARSEKDGKMWTYMQSGGTSTAMKTGSTAIKAASEIIQNAVKRADKAIREVVFPAEQALRKMAAKELDDLADIFKAEMFDGKRFDEDSLIRNLSVKQLEAYTRMRELFDKSLDAQNEARLARGLDPVTPQEAYLSSRWQGDFRRPVYDENGQLVWYLAAQTKLGLEAQTKALLAKQPGLKVGDDHVVRSSAGKSDLESMYTKMLDILGRDDPAVLKVKQAMEDLIQLEGEGTLAQTKHFEKKGNIRGFVGDRPGVSKHRDAVAMFQQQIQYAKNAFQWSEMQKAANDIKAIVSDPELQQKQPNNVKYIREYFKSNLGMGESAVTNAMANAMRNGLGVSPAVLDKAVGGMKSFFITQKLAVSAGYTIANLIQSVNMVPYLLNLRDQGYKGNPAKAVLVGYVSGLGMAAAHYMKAMGREYLDQLPNEFFKRAYTYAEDNGVTARSIYDEAPLDQGSGVYNATMRMAGRTMTTPETLVRSFAFMSYAQMLKDSGKFTDDVKLFQKAEELTNMSMVDYRSGERPMVFSKLGSMGNFLNTLQTFPFSFYNQWSYFLREAAAGRPMGLAGIAAFQFAAAGAMGIPGFNDMDKIYKWIRDNLLPTDTWNSVMKSPFWSDPKLWMLENIHPSVVYGALSDQTGLGLTSRVAAPGGLDMVQAPGGPVLDITKQIGSAGSAIMDPTNSTKWAQAAMNSVPVGLQGLLETSGIMKDHTYVELEDGTKTFLKNSDLADRKGGYTRTPDEVETRKWGLRSQQEVMSREVAYANSSANQALTKKGGELIDRYYAAVRRGDKESMNKLAQLYIDITGKEISETQIQNQIKEELLTDMQRNVDQSKSPRQLLNTTRALKLLEKQ